MKKLSFFLLIFLLSGVVHAEESLLSFEKALGVYLDKKDPQLEQYLRAFPYEKYQIKKIENGLHFYIDLPNDLIKGELFQGKAWEKITDTLVKRYAKPGSVVLDIGAYVGTHAMFMSKCVGPQGKVYAFEPQPKSFRELFMNMKLNNISNAFLKNMALGKEEGKVELSLIPQGNEGMASCYGGSGVFVEMNTLDSFKLNNISLIKIDVEGMEDEVLAGGMKTIQKNRPVLIVEILGRRGREAVYPRSQAKIQQTIKTLKSWGYRVFRYDDNFDFLAIPQGADLKKADFWPEE
jgi:FkbM family methyltransferase